MATKPFSKPVFRPSDIPTGLVAYWKFNNDATDSSGSGYTLTEDGSPTYEVNDYWKTGEYCGVTANGKYFNIAKASAPSLYMNGANGYMTVGGWFKVSAIGGTIDLMLRGGSAGQQAFDLGVGSTGAAFFYTSINGTNWTTTASTTLLKAGTWNHIVGVYDGASILLYINGNLEARTANTSGMKDNTESFRFGYTAYDVFTVKDAFVYNVALTPLQIKSLALGVDLSKYAYRPNNVSVQPTHWWKLNELSGDRADSVTTNPLTLTDNSSVPSAGGYVEGVAAKLNGANADYFSYAAGDDSFVVGTGDFSISLWYNNLGTDAIPRLFDIGGYVANQPYNLSVYGPNSSTGSFKLYTGGSGSATELKDWTCIPVDSDTWTHYVLRRASGTISLFQDGVKVGTDVTGNSTNVTYNEFYLGAWQGIPTAYAPVKIADCGFWKGYALTDEEIKSLACALPIQRQGIVSYWKLNEESGNRADSIGTNTLTDNNTVLYGTGKVSNAADFEASNSEFLSMDNADAIDIVSDMAILGWHKPEAINITQTILDKDYAGDGYGIRIGTDEKVNFYICNDTDVSTTLAVAGTWMHFCGNYDGALKAVWMNGVLEGNGAYSTNPADTTTALRLGSTIAGGDYADGLLDELVLSKRYFRPEEIKAVYLKGLNGKEITTTERGGLLNQITFID